MTLLSEEQTLIQQMAKDFAREILQPQAAEFERQKKIPGAIIQQMGELGLLSMLVPAELGGAGADMVSYALAVAEIAAGDGSVSTLMSVNNSVVCLPIVRYGSSEQQKQWLPKLTSGQAIGAFCLTEPEAGSDAAALKMQAIKKSDHYELNGVKQFITSGQEAAVAVVIAVTDPSLGKKGLSAFLIPTDLPGFCVAKLEEKMGQQASSTAQLLFENVKLPLSCLLGQEGEGYKIALANLEGGRIGIAAQCLGMARAAFMLAQQYAKERQTFGKAICHHQAIAFRLADMATNITLAESLILTAARLKDAGLPCRQECAMAKLFASEMAEKVASQAMQILGGYGYLKDFPIERIYRDVRVAQIYEGTSDVLRMVISRELLAD